MREISLSELETASRLMLEKSQKAMSGGYFHYTRSLLFGLLRRYPNCPELRLLLRQTVVVLNEHRQSRLVAALLTFCWRIYYALVNAPMHYLNRLEQILVETPDSVTAHQAFAEVAYARELWGTAALSLESVVTLKPKAIHEQVLLAQCYLKQGRIEEAQGVIRATLENDPQNDTASELLKQAAVEDTLKKDW